MDEAAGYTAGMTQKNGAALAALAVLLLTLADAYVVYRLPDPSRYVLHTVLRSLALGAAAVAAGFTAARFHWLSEYVGRAWTLLTVLYALLTLSYALTRAHLTTDATYDVMTILANVAAVGAFWLFGRALQNAGLRFYGSNAVKIAVFVGAVVVACALVLPGILDLLRGDGDVLSRTTQIISAIADMATFVLVAPLLLTLWAFRGGQLSWVYGCLALSTVGWMINTAADDLMPSVAVRDTQMAGLFLACMAVLVAAYSQFAVTRSRGAAHV
jgi:hypothetical protein